jgi:hypothetical protein
MKKGCGFALTLVAALFVVAACGSDSKDSQESTPGATTSQSRELTLVGQHDLGGTGGADVWANGEVAYVGARCFGDGVKIVDVSDPAQPRLASKAADHPNTRAEDVMVIDAQTASFEGELLAVGLQDCKTEDEGRDEGGDPGLQGLDLWDVRNPDEPERLGFFDVGPLPSGGVHELYLFQREDRVLALLAVPFSEVFHPDGMGDLRIVDVTDPRNPVQLADWGAGKDGGLAFGAPDLHDFLPEGLSAEDVAPQSDCTPPPGAEPLCRGDMAVVLGHSASANEDGTRAYVSYWDAGMIILDITDPSRPALLGRAADPQGDEGNLHSAIVLPGDKLAITTDEDFVHLEEDVQHGGTPRGLLDPDAGEPRPGDIWGSARIWDISNPARPAEIASFRTPHSDSGRTGGIFTVHNPEVHGDLLYLSWYSDGVRVVDISAPESPGEIASFVPPSEERFGEEIPALVWGVHVEGKLVFLSDMTAGLYVLEMG